MRILGRSFSAAAALLLAATMLTACSTTAGPARSASTSSPTATPTPIFTSDAEALAAAVAVYKQYESVSDAIGRDGGAHPERIRPFVTEAGYEFEKSQAEALRVQHARGVGSAVLNNAVLQSRREVHGTATVTMYVCEDISEVDRVDARGRSLLDPGRPDYFDYQVVLTGRSPGSLVIQSNIAWTGGGICKF